MKPPEPFTWFVDRALGRRLAQELRAAGWKVETHDDHFKQDAEDSFWLADVGQRGWIVLTKDKAIRRNALEQAALVRAGVACFTLGHGNLSAAQMAAAFLAAEARMAKVLRRFDVPLTASVTSTGHVTVLMAEGEILTPPKQIK